jgi:pimeloyl-ACP methyl ester carboxylesterase
MDTVEVAGLRIAYHRLGRGPAAVLLHGYVGDGAATWHPQLEALADEFTLVAWDAPGAGASADPPPSFGMAGYAECLAGFVAELSLKRPHLVGLSFGGALAIAGSGRHPRLARSLVVVSGYAGWRGSLPSDVADQRLAQALTLSELSPRDLEQALLPTMFATRPAADDVQRFAATLRAFHPAGFRAMAEASADDLREMLPTIEVPTLLVYGDQDRRAPLPVAEHLRATIPGSELAILPGVGHVCNLEAPVAFNDILRAWLHRFG